jgi:glycosyltransferase involved in cell wall biosynthesis
VDGLSCNSDSVLLRCPLCQTQDRSGPFSFARVTTLCPTFAGVEGVGRETMNIVLLNDFAFVNGGASKIALGSAVALARRGHTVVLFTAVGPIDPTLLQVDGLTVVCVGQHEILDDPKRLRAAMQGFWNSAAEARLRGVLDQFNSHDTLVHVHMWTKALSASVVRLALDLNFPVVLTLHDYFTACPAGTFFDHPRQEICRLTPMSAACILSNCDSRNYAHKLWRVGRHALQRSKGLIPSGIMDFISISDLSESVLAPLLPARANIHRVQNFIDLERAPAADVASNTLFAFVGRLSPEKGPHLLATASRNLGLQVLFVGDGPMRSEINSIVPTATVTGWLSPAAVSAQLRSARALVLPSLWFETQGLVIAEAAAMGIPSIVPDTCAAKEWVVDGETGLWFRGSDQGDLQAKMLQLHEDPAFAAVLGRDAYKEYWASPPMVEKHCAELEQVYSQMLSKPKYSNNRARVPMPHGAVGQ